MKVLIIGERGREHAISKALAKNPDTQIFYYGPYANPGLDQLASRVENIVDCQIDLAIIGPENHLANGLADKLWEQGIPCIGPKKDLAQIETSKSFARFLMTYSGLKDFAPDYRIFPVGDKDYINYLEELGEYVIKADGLHGGKGVKVSDEHLLTLEDGIKYCEEIHQNKETLLIEEKLIGQEFSLMSFCDGFTLKHLPPIQDFKRAYNGDQGPNTGSMGASSYLPWLRNSDIQIAEKINETIIEALQLQIRDKYIGILYGSYLKTRDGKIKVIEFNARFGDPECINLLSSLKTDFSTICQAMVNGTLSEIDLEFDDQITVSKYLVPNGYPDIPIKHHEIYFAKDLNWDQVIVANLSVEEKNGDKFYYELGSRTIAIIGKGRSLEEANQQVEREIQKISGPLFYRADIGLGQNSYAQAGVNIEEGNMVVERIRESVESTFNSNVINQFGDFSGLYRIPLEMYQEPILVSSVDGVGTKSILVLEKYGPEKGYHMLGQDLVNHCINDTLVKGAKPLFFLDYFASSKISSQEVSYFVEGLSQACRQVGCVLIGGETAEMPGVYQDGKSDLAGTIVGIVEKNHIINGPKDIREGDCVLALPSSGPQTNGYSLIRKIVKKEDPIESRIMDMLCATHTNYYQEINQIWDANIEIKGLCHITGGGLIDNPPRVLPQGLEIEYLEWEMPEVFRWIQEKGNLSRDEMLKVFNCGIGMLIIVANKDKENIMNLLDNMMEIGKVVCVKL